MNASQLWESGDARAWEQAARQAGSAGGLDPLPQDSLGSMDAAAFRDYALERLYPAAHTNPQRLAAAR
ncbi:MAG TPA: hypothetical protein VNT60_06530, partial [Deinococcales bacterium]|nr:hypothetical protein [Deinococcales bacterium]